MFSTHRIKAYAEFVKLPHTVFALPFAVSVLVLIWRDHAVALAQLLWILLALVSARTAAMAFNRIVDRDIDMQNSRTASRGLPRREITLVGARQLLWGSSITFLFSAWALGVHCLILAPMVLGVLFFYSWTKRFTSASHLVLGLSLSLAPGGVWYALMADVSLIPIVLMVAVLFWVAGFDILYSCQDIEFDRGHALFSIPARYGSRISFRIALACHIISLIFLVGFGVFGRFSGIYFIGLALYGLILLSQHRLVRPDDLSKIDAAFFERNGLASLLFFIVVLLDALAAKS